jgi:hypothetical protein
LNSEAKRAVSAGVRLRPAAHDDRRPRALRRLRQGGRVDELVVPSVEREALALGVDHRPLMIASCSSKRSKRSASGGNGMP